MRALLPSLLLLVAASPLRAAADATPVTDPAAVAEPTPAEIDDEWDDPKLARIARLGPDALAAEKRPARPFGSLFDTTRPTPSFKLTYRRVDSKDLDGADFRFHVGEINMYPISLKWLRVGVNVDIGYGGGKWNAFFLTTGLSLGFQYPWRVTPFVEGYFNAGLVGGSVALPSLPGQPGERAILSYMWSGGIDVGFELFLVDRVYLSAAIGWIHPVYRGIDLPYLMAHPLEDPVPKDFASDTFTFKVGIGL